MYSISWNLVAPRGQVAVVPIVFVGALAAIHSYAREYCNDSWPPLSPWCTVR
jgi:hypothetical protein